MPRLHVIVASTRPGRIGKPLADWFRAAATEHGAFDVELIDLAEVNLPFFDEPNHPVQQNYTKQHTRDWSASVSAADAFVLVMPEYNHGFPAPLKNAIDFLFHEWKYKPVGFVSYGGPAGGARAVQMMKPVVSVLKMVPVTESVIVALAVKQVDADGLFQPTDANRAAATAMLNELARVTAALSPLRTPA